MSILFSPSLNAEFDDNVTPLDQIPKDALVFANIFSSEIISNESLEIAPVEIKANVLSNSKKG